ncbi:MAG TPA: glycosyl hydrolase family 18 protein [Terriglobales bacterium]|nr:glycosyl hydrolase family 18 protein [Terriglobales bacterium]
MFDRRGFILAAGAWAALPRWAAASESSRRILYVAGRPTATVSRLGPSAFNVVNLAFLNARMMKGKVRFHYRPLAGVRAAIQALQRNYQVKKKVLLSLGGWGNRSTFEAARAVGVSAFLQQLDDEFVLPLGLDGIDLDLEPSTAAENTPAGWRAVHDELGATLVGLSNGYKQRHPGHLVTHAPIASVAAALYVRDGKLRGIKGPLLQAAPGIDWLNVQFYEAGDVQPRSLEEFYDRQLAQPLKELGFARPGEKVFPGFEPRWHQSRAICEAALRSLNGAARGAFIWDYRQIAADVAGWGAGLEQALERTPA